MTAETSGYECGLGARDVVARFSNPPIEGPIRNWSAQIIAEAFQDIKAIDPNMSAGPDCIYLFNEYPANCIASITTTVDRTTIRTTIEESESAISSIYYATKGSI
jgi:hypothetical protein